MEVFLDRKADFVPVLGGSFDLFLINKNVTQNSKILHGGLAVLSSLGWAQNAFA